MRTQHIKWPFFWNWLFFSIFNFHFLFFYILVCASLLFTCLLVLLTSFRTLFYRHLIAYIVCVLARASSFFLIIYELNYSIIAVVNKFNKFFFFFIMILLATTRKIQSVKGYLVICAFEYFFLLPRKRTKAYSNDHNSTNAFNKSVS